MFKRAGYVGHAIGRAQPGWIWALQKGQKMMTDEQENVWRTVRTHKSSFKPVKLQATERRATLSRMTKRTLGGGNLRMAVQWPDGEDLSEWLAANTVDFFNELSLLYGLAADDAARFTKPGEGFPPGYEYRWSQSSAKKPIRVSSPEYVDYVMTWIEDQMDNPDIFPVDEDTEFPDDFSNYILDIFKRMFRVYAIVYHRHFHIFEEMEAAAHLNTSFKHFMFFTFQFELIPNDRELAVLEGPVNRLRQYFEASENSETTPVLPVRRRWSGSRVLQQFSGDEAVQSAPDGQLPSTLRSTNALQRPKSFRDRLRQGIDQLTRVMTTSGAALMERTESEGSPQEKACIEAIRAIESQQAAAGETLRVIHDDFLFSLVESRGVMSETEEQAIFVNVEVLLHFAESLYVDQQLALARVQDGKVESLIIALFDVTEQYLPFMNAFAQHLAMQPRSLEAWSALLQANPRAREVAQLRALNGKILEELFEATARQPSDMLAGFRALADVVPAAPRVSMRRLSRRDESGRARAENFIRSLEAELDRLTESVERVRGRLQIWDEVGAYRTIQATSDGGAAFLCDGDANVSFSDGSASFNARVYVLDSEAIVATRNSSLQYEVKCTILTDSWKLSISSIATIARSSASASSFAVELEAISDGTTSMRLEDMSKDLTSHLLDLLMGPGGSALLQQSSSEPEDVAHEASDALPKPETLGQTSQPILPFDIFISHHASSAEDQVSALFFDLTNQSYEVWVDKRFASINEVAMVKGIRESKAVLLFLTHRALCRPWVQFELRQAKCQAKPIVVLYETNPARHGLPQTAQGEPTSQGSAKLARRTCATSSTNR